MEIIFLVLILIFLLVINSKLTSKLDDFSLRILQLETLIKKLKTSIDEPKVVEFEKKSETTIVSIPQISIQAEKIIKETEYELKEEKIIAEKELSAVSTPIISPVKTKDIDSIKKPVETKRPSMWETFKENNPDLEKFIGENLINKVGILILILGITYFIKFSIDKNWINEWGRIGIGVLAGTIVFGLAHYLRNSYKSFSSVLVAGSIVIFYFAIYIAFQHYHLFSQTIAFAILTLITALSVLVSLSYNRQELAILSLIGGFIVPFLVSSGEGNFKVLFSYLLILNSGMLFVSYFKKWKLCGILSFIFSALLFNIFLHTDGVNHIEKLTPLFLFSILFYILYLIYILFSTIKNKLEFNRNDTAVFAANTFLLFSQGITILEQIQPEFKGLFTLVLAIINFTIGWVSFYKFNINKKTVYLFVGLCMTFVTLAIPIQFEGFWITLFWSFEALLLLWLWSKTKESTLIFTSIVVYVLATLSLFYFYSYCFQEICIHTLIVNKIFITGIGLALSSSLGVYLLNKNKEKVALWFMSLDTLTYKKGLSIFALILSYCVGMIEVILQSKQYDALSFSANSMVFAYHFMFSIIFIWLLIFKKEIPAFKYATLLIFLNSFLYIIIIANLPFQELKLSCTGIDSNVSWFLSYFFLVALALFLYFLFQIKKQSPDDILLLPKTQTYVFSIYLIILLSIVAMYHAMRIGLFNSGFTLENYSRLFSLNIKVILPILWGIISFVFIFIGIKNQWRNLRIIALGLLALTTLKLFIWDISNISETGKIITFILLGVLILIISFLYQKIKKIIIDDTPKNKEE